MGLIEHEEKEGGREGRRSGYCLPRPPSLLRDNTPHPDCLTRSSRLISVAQNLAAANYPLSSPLYLQIFEDKVVFADGTEFACDAIVACTGDATDRHTSRSFRVCISVQHHSISITLPGPTVL
jgi:hypothetical protein